MLRVTFYSYKGGVGRTLALLNVAALLAEQGRRVLVVDLDLEAPGFGLSSMTRPTEKRDVQTGVSDFLLDRSASIATPISNYVYSAMGEHSGDRLQVMTAGTRPGELASKIESFYRDPQGDTAHLFTLLLAEIDAFLAPDYIFFDSRTGLADVAGVCTMELPDVVIAIAGLNEQNIGGMERALSLMREYWRSVSRDVAVMLVLSPVPRDNDLGVQPFREVYLSFRDQSPIELTTAAQHHPLGARLHEAQARLLAPLLQDLPRIQQRFTRLDREDLIHVLEYDPWIPLRDDERSAGALAQQYQRLTHSIACATEADTFDIPAPVEPPPILV
jgi:MinD-like ATPase involved in chromosome partitioning or flagellar assembly